MKPSKPPAVGPITTALLDAVTMRRQMLDNGHAASEVDHHIGVGLKALLGRGLPRFLCSRCRDTGWVTSPPSATEMRRIIALYGDDAQTQDYVVKCDPCAWNANERVKRRVRGQDTGDGGADDVVAAGQTTSTRGFRKVGRR